MALVKIPILDQWQDNNDLNADGFVLKAYEYRTTTPKTIYYNNSLSNTLETATLNANGVFELANNEITLYTDDRLRLALYRNASDAAADQNPFYGPIDISLSTEQDSKIAGITNKYDEFDDRYLGSKASDPTVDNDGDPILTGANYWNSGGSDMRVYNGASWDQIEPWSGLGINLKGFLLEYAYDPGYYSYSAGSIDLRDFVFSDDGLKVFIIVGTFSLLREYPLTRAFDLRTVGSLTTTFPLAAQESQAQAAAFNPGGTKLYVVGASNDTVYEYTLTTGFSLSTASYSGNSFSVATEIDEPTGIGFSQDGTRMLVLDNGTTDAFYQYNLTTGFDLTTASYSTNSFSVATQDTDVRGLAVSTFGDRVFVNGSTSRTIYQYSLTTGFDASTAAYSNISYPIPATATESNGLAFSNDGSRMYPCVRSGGFDTIYQVSTNIIRA